MLSDKTLFLAAGIGGAVVFISELCFLIINVWQGTAVPIHAWLILGTTLIAWSSLMVTIWMNRRQARAQQTLQFLSTIRLDKEYLGFATAFRDILPQPGLVMPAEALELLTGKTTDGKPRDKKLNSSEEKFRKAASFLLNFYEVIAAGAYRGDYDHDLLRRTARGNIVRLVITCSEWIAIKRKRPGRQRVHEHLVWFYQTFATMDDLPEDLRKTFNSPKELDLGPPPDLKR